MGEQNLFGGMSECFNKMKAYLAMIALQFGYAGMYIITLVSLKGGFSHWILVFYRHIVAAAVVSPFAYFLEKPVLDQNMYNLGMQYTSATFASAISNILLAITFMLAVIFRLEKINLKKIHCLAKVIGTIITVSGAMLMALYKGPVIDILWHSQGGDLGHISTVTAADQQWIAGTIMLLCSVVGCSAFFILQNKTLKEYPAHLSLTSLVCILGMVENGILAAITERRRSAWALGFDSRLLAVVYSGIVCSGISYYVSSVVNKARGPVFVSAFSPVSMIITAILGAIVLSEQVHLGSLIGAAIIVVGLYSVVWGKSKEVFSPSSPDKLVTSDDDKGGGPHQLPVVVVVAVESVQVPPAEGARAINTFKS